MKKVFLVLFVLISSTVISQNTNTDSVKVKLPKPSLKGSMSVEEALSVRRSIRVYKDTSLTLKEVSQILWAAYGITDTIRRNGIGLHTAPSAMALYPLSIYIVAGNILDLPSGIYRYHPKGHYLSLIKSGDYRTDLYEASNNQYMIKSAPFNIVYSADTSLVNNRYGKNTGIIMASMDLGHSAENVYLQATALDLGTCAVGGLKPEKVAAIFNMTENEKAVYIMPVGRY
ncbi:MAG TPA: SagB/ThcOx family dehydrogenase [Bacteroidales bacterium]|nr:SagB/ThcOx family dehydrogenase [Bacteroidales bacterium]HPS17348.1 SagB/ThcOx family dehydrogenase [Bacteroidales bacterium]